MEASKHNKKKAKTKTKKKKKAELRWKELKTKTLDNVDNSTWKRKRTISLLIFFKTKYQSLLKYKLNNYIYSNHRST